MGLFSFFNTSRPLPTLVGSTLIVAKASDIARGAAFITQVQNQFGNVGLGVLEGNYSGDLPHINLPGNTKETLARIAKPAPQRVMMIGLNADYAVPTLAAVTHWINASDPRISQIMNAGIFVDKPQLMSRFPGAEFTGDPMLNLETLPPYDESDCTRFQEHHQTQRWLGYFAATEEHEEAIAYQLFSRLIRQRMGLMMLAPRDPARWEPVYRDALKYRLQTIRHTRLSTSYVPIKTRVYYIEEALARNALYGCADFVVAGASLQSGTQTPDIITPLLHARPVIVGPAGRHDHLVQAAIAAGAVMASESMEAVFDHARQVIERPDESLAAAEAGRVWLLGQSGAAKRVLASVH